MLTSLRSSFVSAFWLVLGCFCFGLSVSLFFAPNQFAPGGITGLATVLNAVSGFPIGVATALLNLPLLVIAWKKLGKAFVRLTVAGILVSSFFLDWIPTVFPAFTGDRWLAAVTGGCLSGIGLGFLFMHNASTGGTEIIARLLEKRWPHISLGRLVLLADAAVIVLSAFAFRQLESALYSATAVFIATHISDRMIYGGRQGKTALIFSTKSDELVKEITAALGYGVTRFPAVGGYSGAPRPMLLCAVRRSQWTDLKSIIRKIDPAAFLLLLTADEIRGDGWLSLQD